jgi:hypothetical protein
VGVGVVYGLWPSGVAAAAIAVLLFWHVLRYCLGLAKVQKIVLMAKDLAVFFSVFAVEVFLSWLLKSCFSGILCFFSK